MNLLSGPGRVDTLPDNLVEWPLYWRIGFENTSSIIMEWAAHLHVTAITFPVDVLPCLSHWSMSEYTEAHQYLDRAETHIKRWLSSEILPPLRHAMLPYNLLDERLKQEV